jgi:hypothetical protein
MLPPATAQSRANGLRGLPTACSQARQVLFPNHQSARAGGAPLTVEAEGLMLRLFVALALTLLVPVPLGVRLGVADHDGDTEPVGVALGVGVLEGVCEGELVCERV